MRAVCSAVSAEGGDGRTRTKTDVIVVRADGDVLCLELRIGAG